MTVFEQGVDYAWDRPTPQELLAARKTFAVRYIGPGSKGKQLDAAELKGLTAAGISVVANAEGLEDAFVDAAAGVSWARQAQADAKALGMPANRPVYFSVDFNTVAGDMARIDVALRAAASVIGSSYVGVYGEYDVIRHCWLAKTAQWFWQTLAWSAGRWATGINHIEQYQNRVPLGSGLVDLDRAVKQDFGQWGVQKGTHAVWNNLGDGTMPILTYGMTDPVDGGMMVTRLQRLLSITDDGIYGPQTQAAVDAYYSKYLSKTTDGRTAGTDLWRRLIGMRSPSA